MVLVYVILIAILLIGLSFIYMQNLKKKIIEKRKALSKDIRKSIDDGTFNELNADGHTPLMLTILGHFDKSFEKLLFAGADVNIKGHTGEQALHLAAHHSKPYILKRLLEDGAEINTKDDQGCTPLWYAAQNNRYENVALLIESGADLNAVDATYGLSPVMIAAQNGAYQSVDKLIEAGADLTIEAENFGTAYDIAKNRLGDNIKKDRAHREELEVMVESLKVNKSNKAIVD